MSTVFLTTGSAQPPKTEGLLRLYSNVFCPFAQRARLVLEAKQIPHEIVNIDLGVKPEWYSNVHPQGKVPALDDESKVTVESLAIADLLDEKYPDPPLYPADPASKQKDKDIISKIDPFTAAFYTGLFTDSSVSAEEKLQVIDNALDKLSVFDNELAERGTPFFGGDRPGMVDYMLWPWGERLDALSLALETKLPEEQKLPHYAKWRKTMKETPVAKKLYVSGERFFKVVEAKKKNLEIDLSKV